MGPEWIIAGATLIYAFFTGWIIFEMRKDRVLIHKPVLDARLIDARYPDWLKFEVKNVGRGPALKCMFNCKDDGALKWAITDSGFPVGGGESLELEFQIEEKYDRDLGSTIWLDAAYTDIFNHKYRERIFQGSAKSVMKKFGVV